MRQLAKAVLPLRWRRLLRHEITQLPQRLRDLPADLVCLLRPDAFGGPLPPPGLRSRVGQLSREVFRRVGREGRDQILSAFERAREPGREYPNWLDFGCGCGRIARYLADANPPVAALYGVDVDPDLVGWASRNLRGRFATMRPDPPIDLAAEAFDAVYATSIFTHYGEREQDAWLRELARVLRPGGLFFATTMAPAMSTRFPALTAADLDSLAQTGFVCANPGGAFNARAAFHSQEYLERTWSRFFRFRFYEAQGFVAFQDLSVWEKPAADGGP